MKYILIGSFSFVFFFFFDIFTLKNKNIVKKFIGLLGLMFFIYSLLEIIITSGKIYFPMPLRIISLILWIAATFLLIYSLFLELPFVKTYGKEYHNNKLVDTGTYALCRHPGVLWFGFLFLFLFFATGSALLIPAGILWTFIDIIYVILQEKFIFNKQFSEYTDYMKSTPMLIPTKKSIKKCVSTIFIWRDKNGKLRGNAKAKRL